MRRIGFIGAVVAAMLGAFGAIARAQIPGDANCDDIVSATDEPALVFRVFNDIDDCFGADANTDGALTAADLVALPPLLIPPTPTPTPLPGPHITFFGLAAADGRVVPSLGEIEPGVSVYYRPSGSGFKVVVEAVPGLSGSDLGFTVSNSDPGDPTKRPDLQIESNQPLGNGSPAVCDDQGVPGIDPPDFSVTQPISDALNDLSCHFDVATSRRGACTQDAFGFIDFVSDGARGQYCLQVPTGLRFPLTDTRLTVQLRDRGGHFGAPASLIVRVSTDAVPSPFTPTPSPTPTSPRPTHTATRTPTATVSPTTTRTQIPTVTPFASPTSSATPVLSPTPTATATGPTPTASRTVTRTATRSATPSPSVTQTATSTGTSTRTATQTTTPTVTSTPTPTAAIGPTITFFGITTGEGKLPTDPPIIENGVAVYVRAGGLGFHIVVEGTRGSSGRSVAVSTFNGNGRPDLQILANHTLGNGSSDVCDTAQPNPGGVPAVDPPRFDDDPMITDALNDLGCRFTDGAGNPNGRTCDNQNACILFDSGEFGCVSSDADCGGSGLCRQFCGEISRTVQLPAGDTLFEARLRDTAGNVGEPARLIIRVTP